jgi:probable H4MPT-linked C1 transfer pathway protein
MKKKTIGWDIGGAHVKAAVLNAQGEILNILQIACPLWKGLEYLEQAIQMILHSLEDASYLHCMTMTGELADCFTSRQQGVESIITCLHNLLPQQELLIYTSEFGFLSVPQIKASHTLSIASVNWLASSKLTATHCEQGLFVDIGSTTTDLLLIQQQQVLAIGYTDYARLVSGELVYTGVVRTAVMAIAQQAFFNGQTMGLMAEYFATMADVYRLTADLATVHDQADTADGADKSLLASARRLSRLTGYEFQTTDMHLWLAFAVQLKQLQKQKIWLACQRQLARLPIDKQQTLIGAGVGRFLLKEIALEHTLNYLDFNDFCKQAKLKSELDAADCAPAVAVAYLGGGFG